MRLWDSGSGQIDEVVLDFTVGDDPQRDLQIVPYDCMASKAHAQMLEKIGVLSAAEMKALGGALHEACRAAEEGTFDIPRSLEDGHTALEYFLTERAGDAGKKIHTGRSRNDQVIMALRLWVRQRLLDLLDQGLSLARALCAQAARYRQTVMPGYTHTRQAMLSTVGQLFAAVAEGLTYDLQALQTPLRLANRSALGSASGYGVPLALDRVYVAQLLGLDGVDLNTIEVQNSRGKLELTVIFCLHQMSLTLSRFATDLIWFSSEAFGFFSLPEALTTGSSIMPQKRNPDVLELVRAVPASMMGRYVECAGVLHGLTEGYQRDLQHTKGPMLQSLSELSAVLRVMEHLVTQIEVHPERCSEALEAGIFATDRTYAYVRRGLSFRQAYHKVKGEPEGEKLDPVAALEQREHLGAPGQEQSEMLLKGVEGTHQEFQRYRDGAACAWALVGR